jgi:ketosteroid isomerase-like protein
MRAVVGACGALLLVLAGCMKPETPEQAQARMSREVAAARPALDSIARRWERYTAAAQPDSIAMLFTEQGEQLPPNGKPVVGRPAIQAFQTRSFSLGPSSISISSDEVLVNGPLAVSRGGYTYEVKVGPNSPPGMKAIADTGKYLIHWHQIGARWLIADQAWSSNIPLPAPPTPAAKPAAKRVAKPRARTTVRRTH